MLIKEFGLDRILVCIFISLTPDFWILDKYQTENILFGGVLATAAPPLN